MANIGSDFKDGLNEVLKLGQLVRFRYFNSTAGAGSYYDDNVTLTSGTDVWVSGIPLPIDTSRGSSDAVLLEQGYLLTNDTKLYVRGAINTSGTYRIGFPSGNPPTNEYGVLPDGVITWNVNAEDVVNKLYIRRLTTGSLSGEI